MFFCCWIKNYHFVQKKKVLEQNFCWNRTKQKIRETTPFPLFLVWSSNPKKKKKKDVFLLFLQLRVRQKKCLSDLFSCRHRWHIKTETIFFEKVHSSISIQNWFSFRLLNLNYCIEWQLLKGILRQIQLYRYVDRERVCVKVKDEREGKKDINLNWINSDFGYVHWLKNLFVIS